MMTCTEARERLIEADLDELEPSVASDLGAHLLACDDCRAMAETIRTAERGLADRRGAARPSGDDTVAALAAAATWRRRARRRLAGALVLAAAAVLAAVLLVPRGRTPPAQAVAAQPPVPAGVSVTAQPGQQLMVLHATDPNIVVVWFFSSRRSS
jgi:predicted anti-sigma-YlaC factor YlaD